MRRRIRIVVADHQPSVRAGIRAALATQPDMVIVGEGACGDDVSHLCRQLQPDIVLLDINLPGPAAAEIVACLQTRCPSTRVLALTRHDDPWVGRLVAAGVAGYILKDETLETVVHAIRAVMHGGVWFSRSIIAKLARSGIAKPEAAGLSALTRRDRQLLEMISQGWSTARIAAELGFAQQTVRNYLSRLYRKLGVRSRAEAIVWARDHGQELAGPDADRSDTAEP